MSAQVALILWRKRLSERKLSSRWAPEDWGNFSTERKIEAAFFSLEINTVAVLEGILIRAFLFGRDKLESHALPMRAKWSVSTYLSTFIGALFSRSATNGIWNCGSKLRIKLRGHDETGCLRAHFECQRVTPLIAFRKKLKRFRFQAARSEVPGMNSWENHTALGCLG